MKASHHSLELINAPPEMIRDAVLQWFDEAGFSPTTSPSDFHVTAKRGSCIGLTDAQTERIMEVIIKSSGEVTAVSIHHQAGRIGPIAGVMFGTILSDEVNALSDYLRDAVITNKKSR